MDLRSQATIALITCVLVAPVSSAEPSAYLGSALRPAHYRADTFTMGIPTTLAEVQRRFADAVARKQAWVQAYIARLNLKPGAPLPYDEAMEVTREEYAALVAAYASPSILPLGTTYLDVEVRDGVTHLRVEPPYDFMKDISIDKSGVLHGPMNLEARPKNVSSLRAKFGSWSGTSWQLEVGDNSTESFRTFELSIGKLDDSKRMFLSFADHKVENKKAVFSHVLLAWLSDEKPRGHNGQNPTPRDAR